jgi:hypothetical protein
LRLIAQRDEFDEWKLQEFSFYLELYLSDLKNLQLKLEFEGSQDKFG